MKPIASMTVFLAFLLLWVALPSHALDPELRISQYVRENWTVDQGLPQNTVADIYQDEKGYLWLATQEGLARFDGVSFKVFTISNTPVLRSQLIQCLASDLAGGIWVGTDNGLYRFTEDRVLAYGPEEGLLSSNVNAICPMENGDLWVGTFEGGLQRLRNGKLEPPLAALGAGEGSVYGLLRGRDGELWVAHLRGLFRVDADMTVTHIDEIRDYRFGAVFELMHGPGGLLWLGTNQGLVALGEDEIRRYDTEHGLMDNIVTALAADRDSNIWVGTNSGVHRFDGERFEAETFLHTGETDPILAIREDHEGNLWLGRNAYGLTQLRNADFATFTREEGLVNDMVRCMTQDEQGRFWLGTDGGLLVGETDSWRPYTSADGLPGNVVLSLAFDGEGTLWIGTFGAGLASFSDGKFRVYQMDDGSLPDNRVRVVHHDRKGRLWIGTGKGLVLRENGQFSTLSQVSGRESIWAVLEDRDGHMWFGTESRILRLEDGDPERVQVVPWSAERTVLAFYQDRQGAVWIGTYGRGLIRYYQGKVFRVGVEHGLFDDKVFKILEDDSGILWMSSNRGIFSVPLTDLYELVEGRTEKVSCRVFGTADGMKSVECNGGSHPAGLKDSKGRLWFPTGKGLVNIDPDSLQRNEKPPNVLIEGVTVDGVTYPLDEIPVLDEKTRKVAFQYTALSFTEPDRVRFSYRLKGSKEGWIDAGSRRVAFFTNLPSGDYEFEVKAANNDGVWSHTEASTPFRVAIPLWYRGGFWVSVCVFILFAVLIRHVRSVGKIEEMEGRSRARLQELENDIANARDTLEERHQALADVSHGAHIADISNNVLLNVTSMLSGVHRSVRTLEKLLKENRYPDGLRRLRETIHLQMEVAEDAREEVHIDEALADQLNHISRSMNEDHDALINEVVVLRDQIHQMGDLVEAQQEYAKTQGDLEMVDLNVLLDDALRMKNTFIREHHVETIQDMLPVPLIKVNKSRLMQVVIQLIRQAVVSLERRRDLKHKILIVRTKNRVLENEVFLEIEHNGVGFAPGALSNPEKLNLEEDGVGVDLALLARVVGDLGGRFFVLSQGLERGAVFVVALRSPEEETPSDVD